MNDSTSTTTGSHPCASGHDLVIGPGAAVCNRCLTVVRLTQGYDPQPLLPPARPDWTWRPGGYRVTCSGNVPVPSQPMI